MTSTCIRQDISTHTYMNTLHTEEHTHIQTHKHTCAYTTIHMHRHTQIHAHTYIHIYTYMQYNHTFTHTCTYRDTHTQARLHTFLILHCFTFLLFMVFSSSNTSVLITQDTFYNFHALMVLKRNYSLVRKFTATLFLWIVQIKIHKKNLDKDDYILLIYPSFINNSLESSDKHCLRSTAAHQSKAFKWKAGILSVEMTHRKCQRGLFSCYWHFIIA